MPRTLTTISIPAEPVRNRAARATQRTARFGHRTEPRGGARNAFRADLGEYFESLDGSEDEPPSVSAPSCRYLSCVCEHKGSATFAGGCVDDQMNFDWALDRGEDPLSSIDDRDVTYLDREVLLEAARFEDEWVYGDLVEHILEEVLASSPEMYEKLVRGGHEAWRRSVDREMNPYA